MITCANVFCKHKYIVLSIKVGGLKNVESYESVDCLNDFLYSDGDCPVEFLNIRLNDDLELKPQSKAIPNKEKISASPFCSLLINASTR